MNQLIEIIGRSIRVSDNILSLRIDFPLIPCEREGKIYFFIGTKKAFLNIKESNNTGLQLVEDTKLTNVRVGEIEVKFEDHDLPFTVISKKNYIQILYSDNKFISGNPEHQIKIGSLRDIKIEMSLLKLCFLLPQLDKELDIFQKELLRFFFQEWNIDLKMIYSWSMEENVSNA